MDTRQDIIARVLTTTVSVAPETRGATLVVITEGQGDWLRAHAISKDVEKWMETAGSSCIWPEVHHVRSAKNNVGVSQTAPKKSQMVFNMANALRPESAGIAFHRAFKSPCESVDAKGLLATAKEQLLGFTRKKNVPSEASLGRRPPTITYTGKVGGSQDDLAMVLLMATYEPRAFMESIVRLGF